MGLRPTLFTCIAYILVLHILSPSYIKILMYILLSELLLRTFLSSLVSIGVSTLQLPPLRSPTPQRPLLLSSPCADILARGSLAAIGVLTRSHVLPKHSALKLTHPTYCQLLQADVTRDVSNATSALIYVSIQSFANISPNLHQHPIIC